MSSDSGERIFKLWGWINIKMGNNELWSFTGGH